jgi:pilus assembly protein CpaF
LQIHLTIFERLNNAKKPAFRKRLANITSDSVTIGNQENADIELKAFLDPFLLEIKFAAEEWWIVNVRRTPGISVSGTPLSLDARLEHNAEIAVDGHKIIFELKQSAFAEMPEFIPQPKTDEALWDYILSEREFDEVMINGAAQIFVDWRGVVLKAPWQFSNDSFLSEKIREQTNKTSGWFSWRLNRTLRIHGALPPVVETPHISIRKAKQKVLSLDQLEETGFAKVSEMEFLRRALKEKQNIIVSGGTSTGKTVLLRSLLEQVDPADRLIVVEEEAETDWPHPHVVAIEAGRGNLRTTVVECLRMRPTRLIISEVRGAEAFEMLTAMNTGHSGSMTTIHANSAREALSRLEGLVLSSGVNLNVNAVRRMLAQTINIIVQLSRNSHGKRFIEHIVRVSGIQQDMILLSDPVGLEAAGIKQKLTLVD